MNIGGLVKNSFVDYPKNICCVIFTTGCNMNCWYCHNKHLINSLTSQITEEDVLNFLTSHKPFLDAVTISGGEPTLQEDLTEFIKKIKELGYKIKLDTNGTNFVVLQNLINQNLLDYVALDIKAPLNKYDKISPNYNVNDIEKSINLLKQNLVPYEFRTTFCPNLTLEDIEEIAKKISGATNYSIQQFSKVSIDNSFKGSSFESCFSLEPLSEEELKMAKKLAEKYVKNVTIKNL